MGVMRRFILSLIVVTLVTPFSPALAAGPRDRAAESVSTGPRKHLQTIVFAGLAGAILGLSTLSFYGRPQDKLSNIALGFAFGVITGTVYSTYKAATEPKDFYNLRDFAAPVESWAALDAKDRWQVQDASQTLTPSLRFEF